MTSVPVWYVCGRCESAWSASVGHRCWLCGLAGIANGTFDMRNPGTWWALDEAMQEELFVTGLQQVRDALSKVWAA